MKKIIVGLILLGSIGLCDQYAEVQDLSLIVDNDYSWIELNTSYTFESFVYRLSDNTITIRKGSTVNIIDERGNDEY